MNGWPQEILMKNKLYLKIFCKIGKPRNKDQTDPSQNI